MKNIILLPLLAACAVSPNASDLTTVKANATGGAELPATPDDGSCDYTEAEDTTNDNTVDPDAIELTGLDFPGTSTLCGVINNGHYSAMYDTVDVDNYLISTGSGDLGFVVAVPDETILAAGGEIAINLTDLDGNPVTGGFVVDDIAAFHVFERIQEGSYQLNVRASGTGSDSPAAFPYTITIVGDN